MTPCKGRAEHLGVYLGATPGMVEERRRGLFSYEALQTRLEESRFANRGLRDMSGPLIRLDPLSESQLCFLLQTIRDIHAWHNRYDALVNDSHLRAFLTESQSRVGADSRLTPREVLRDYVSLLNLLRQYPRESFESILGKVDFATGKTADPDMQDSLFASFQI